MSYGVNIGDKVLIRGVIVRRAGNQALVKTEAFTKWFDIAYLLPEVAVERALDPVVDGRNSEEGMDPHDEGFNMRP